MGSGESGNHPRMWLLSGAFDPYRSRPNPLESKHLFEEFSNRLESFSPRCWTPLRPTGKYPNWLWLWLKHPPDTDLSRGRKWGDDKDGVHMGPLWPHQFFKTLRLRHPFQRKSMKFGADCMKFRARSRGSHGVRAGYKKI